MTHPLRRRITAAAQLDPRGVAGVIPQRSEARRAWDLYRMVPELQAGTEWVSNAVSRADLYIARRTPDGLVRDDDEQANSALDALFGGTASQGELLKRMVTHMEVPGETFLVPYDAGDGAVWTAATNEELRSTGSSIEYQVDTATWVPVGGPEKVIRIWHPDPVRRWMAQSPVVAMEPILQQIISGTARANTVNESRIAGNGLLGLSENLQILTPSSEGVANPAQERDFFTAFEDAAVAPMTDRGLVHTVVPLLVTGPKEDLPTQDSYIRFDSPLDERATEQLEQALRRMAISMSLPPELILGLGESNHWNAFVIRDEAVTTTIEPRADLIASALTTAYLRPLLGSGARNLVVAVDLTDLVVKPDRSEAAASAREQGLITDEAYTRYLGFEDDDIPDGRERQEMILRDLLRRDPSTAPWVLPELGITIPGFTAGGGGASAPVRVSSPPALEPVTDPVPGDEPQEGGGSERGSDPGMPERPVAASLPGDDGVESGVIDAVECAALRVLEIAGNRLKGSCGRKLNAQGHRAIDMHVHVPVKAEARSRLFDGVYDIYRDHVPGLVPIVDTYVAHLYDHQQPHSRELLTETLRALSDYMPQQREGSHA